MFTSNQSQWPGESRTWNAGQFVLHRGAASDGVLHIASGRVALGIADGDSLVHRMGMVEGPAWLNAGWALLGLDTVVDAVAETAVRASRIPLADFQAELHKLPPSAFEMLRDLAQAHHQQTELAVSRLAKDAEARCAEWLLRHAEPSTDSPGKLAVMLRERKRQIAAQLGIAPETFSRVLRQLRERSLISGSGRVLNVLDARGLRALAGA